MTELERKTIEIANHFGLESQMDVAQEECAELVQAISKLRRVMQTGLETSEQRVAYIAARGHVAEEMADVLNLLLQLAELLNNHETVRLWLNQKHERTLDKIAKGEL